MSANQRREGRARAKKKKRREELRSERQREVELERRLCEKLGVESLDQAMGLVIKVKI